MIASATHLILIEKFQFYDEIPVHSIISESMLFKDSLRFLYSYSCGVVLWKSAKIFQILSVSIELDPECIIISSKVGET